MPDKHKRPRYRVIFYRKKEIMLFSWSHSFELILARTLADELATTLGHEWTVEVLDTHNRVDRLYAVAYETFGYLNAIRGHLP